MKNEDVKKMVLEKGIFDPKENLRIYNKFFDGWFEKNSYIFNRFGVKETDKILDIGSNYGHNLIHFDRNSVGIEIEKRLVEFAKGLGLNVLEINIEENWSLNNKFDVIWCSDVLPHLFSPFKFLYEVRKVLSDNGKLVIQMPLMSIFGKHRSVCHLYAFNKKSLIYLLEMSGFKILKTSGCIRRLPGWLNRLLEPLLQRAGGNIWIMAVKDKEVKINFKKVFPPDWFVK